MADLFDLPFDAGSFDVVHADQVLQHLGDPVAGLVAMRRVCAPGGIVAARDSDYPTMTFYPSDPDLDGAIAAYGELTRVNGANWDAGRLLLHWAHRGGFETVVPSGSAWCYATPEERGWWGGLWADRFTRSSLADQLLVHGIATADDLAGSPPLGDGGRTRPTVGSRCSTARSSPCPEPSAPHRRAPNGLVDAAMQ